MDEPQIPPPTPEQIKVAQMRQSLLDGTFQLSSLDEDVDDDYSSWSQKVEKHSKGFLTEMMKMVPPFRSNNEQPVADDARIQALQLRMDEMEKRAKEVDRELEERKELEPMRLYNARVFDVDALRFPRRLTPEQVAGMPKNLKELRALTAERCAFVEEALGLPILANASIEQRHKGIEEYLGVFEIPRTTSA